MDGSTCSTFTISHNCPTQNHRAAGSPDPLVHTCGIWTCGLNLRSSAANLLWAKLFRSLPFLHKAHLAVCSPPRISMSHCRQRWGKNQLLIAIRVLGLRWRFAQFGHVSRYNRKGLWSIHTPLHRRLFSVAPLEGSFYGLDQLGLYVRLVGRACEGLTLWRLSRVNFQQRLQKKKNDTNIRPTPCPQDGLYVLVPVHRHGGYSPGDLWLEERYASTFALVLVPSPLLIILSLSHSQLITASTSRDTDGQIGVHFGSSRQAGTRSHAMQLSACAVSSGSHM